LRRAHQLDERNPSIRAVLRDGLVERARRLPETDWRTAEELIDSALALDPQNQLARTVRAQVHDAKRDDAIMQCASQARRWQAAGELAKAETELKRGLAVYPGDPRLTAILDTLQHELEQSNRKKARLRDMEELRSLQREASATTNGDELTTILSRTQAVGARYTSGQADADITAMAREIERVARARIQRAQAGEPANDAASNAAPHPAESGAAVQPSPRSRHLAVSSRAWIGAAAAVLVVLGLGAWIWQLGRKATVRAPSGLAAPVTVRVRTTPPGA